MMNRSYIGLHADNARDAVTLDIRKGMPDP